MDPPEGANGAPEPNENGGGLVEADGKEGRYGNEPEESIALYADGLNGGGTG
jgi:hypothetical protein